MKIYNINEKFIEFLRQFEDKVPQNKFEKRPYIGVVLQINDIKYYAPLSSPKPKHKQMKNDKDFRKINQGIYGAINFNNMIPVQDKALIEIDIDNMVDYKYRRLLQNQAFYINQDKTEIVKTARNLREIILKQDGELTTQEIHLKQRCCNLKLLEEKYKDWSV